MFSKQFWFATVERALRTFAQALAALIGAGAVGLLGFDWPANLSVAGMAAVAAVLTAVAAPNRISEGLSDQDFWADVKYYVRACGENVSESGADYWPCEKLPGHDDDHEHTVYVGTDSD